MSEEEFRVIKKLELRTLYITHSLKYCFFSINIFNLSKSVIEIANLGISRIISFNIAWNTRCFCEIWRLMFVNQTHARIILLNICLIRPWSCRYDRVLEMVIHRLLFCSRWKCLPLFLSLIARVLVFLLIDDLKSMSVLIESLVKTSAFTDLVSEPM